MSSDRSTNPEGEEIDPDELREEFAQAFDRPTDPLKEHSPAFENLPDPFEYFMIRVVENRDRINKQGTIEGYRRTYRQWREFMSNTDRHPACPSIQQIKSYIEWRQDIHNNEPETIKIKFGRLRQAYEHWQRESVFPHPSDYNPFEIAYEEASFGDSSKRSFPDLTIGDVRGKFSQISDIQSRCLVATQLKQGIRAGEIFNLKLEDLHLSHRGVQRAYPQLGTHQALGDYNDVVYIEPDREGTKSKVGRLIPIDEELRWLMIRHLLTRPQVDKPWVFLSNRAFGQLCYGMLNKSWKSGFHPEYDGDDTTRPITSHFGRHWFSSYLRLEAGFSREHVQYLRGDRIEPVDDFAEAIDDYLHPNYEQIESKYRSEIFKLDLPKRHHSR
jgi:integrase/recombinase XerD